MRKSRCSVSRFTDGTGEPAGEGRWPLVKQAVSKFQRADRVRSLATGRTGVIQSVDVSSRTRVTCYRVRLDHPDGVLLDYSAVERQEDDLAFHSLEAQEERGD